MGQRLALLQDANEKLAAANKLAKNMEGEEVIIYCIFFSYCCNLLIVESMLAQVVVGRHGALHRIHMGFITYVDVFSSRASSFFFLQGLHEKCFLFKT